jgi:hypothetical protein
MIKSIIAYPDSATTLFEGIVDSLHPRDGQHYMAFRMPSGFDQRESFVTKVWEAGARRQPTSDTPWQRDTAIIGCGLGGAMFYVPYDPNSFEMRGVRWLDHVSFTLDGNLHRAAQVKDAKVTYKPTPEQRAFDGDRNAYRDAAVPS